MGQLKILSTLDGHKTLEYDVKDERSVADAEAEFVKIMERSGLAYKVTEKGNEQIREFDPSAETIVIHEQLQGG